MRNINIIISKENLSDAQKVRKEVFQIEQGISSKLDFDGQDSQAVHLVAYDNDKPIGTVRVRFINGRTAKIERLAVIKNYRGKHIGKLIMEKISDYLSHQNVSEATLDSQSYVKGFYEKLGYEQEGEEFQEVGIPHVKMVKHFYDTKNKK